MFHKYKYALFIFLVCVAKTYSQESFVYKDFNNINLDNLSLEGPVGHLMMKAHLTVDLDSTLLYIDQAEKLAFKTKDTLLIPYINYHLGYAHYNKQNFDLSETYLNKCISIASIYKLRGMQFESYNLLGLIKKDQRLFGLSLDYFKKALEFAPTTYDKLYLKINISGIYLDTNKEGMAKLYLDEVLDFNNNNKNVLEPYWMAYAFLNYSKVVKGFRDKSKYISLAITQAEKEKDMHVLLQANIVLSDIYLEFNKYKQALVIAHQNLKLALQYNYIDSVVRIELILAQLYYKLNQHETSLSYLDSIRNKTDVEWMNFQINELYYENLYKIGEYKKAFLSAKKHIKFLDSILLNKQDKTYAEYAKKYQTEKKIQENLSLIKDNQIKSLVISKEKIKRYLISILCLLLVLIIFVFYFRYQNKKSITEVLKTKNDIITKQNQKLEIANKTKQKLFSIVAHDLINPFNALLGYADVLKADYLSLSDQERQAMIAIIAKYANQNYNLTNRLLTWSRTQQNRLTINKVTLNAKKTIIEAIAPYKLLAYQKNIKTVLNINSVVTIWADKDSLITTITNLYCNAIKFTNFDGLITIDVHNRDNATIIKVIDNGVGMTQKQLNNIFSLLIKTTSRGTNNEKGSGFGLLICNELTVLQNGKLRVHSVINEGTEITIELPRV